MCKNSNWNNIPIIKLIGNCAKLVLNWKKAEKKLFEVCQNRI